MELQRALDAAHVLREWNTLKEEGIITDDEWRAMKAKLVSSAVHHSEPIGDAALDAEHVLFLERAKRRFAPPLPPPAVSDDESDGEEDREDEAAAQSWARRQIDVRAPRPEAPRRKLEPLVIPAEPKPQRRRRSPRRARPPMAAFLPESPPGRPRTFTRGERDLREKHSLGLSTSASEGSVCWNASSNPRSRAAVPSTFRRPWQDEREAPSPPKPTKQATPSSKKATPPATRAPEATRPKTCSFLPPWSPIDTIPGRTFDDPPLTGPRGVTPAFRRSRARANEQRRRRPP